MIRIQKGTKDMLPQEAYKWHYIDEKIKSITKLFGFLEIRTPTFEATELFQRGIGETTDIVNKEMYTFEDKGKRSITLKPEGTASVVRSYIENNIFQEYNPAKMYYITSVFRYERPQSGRLREHHQFGVEIFGSDSYIADLEVILLGYTFFKSLGISDVRLHINNIGCSKCRVEYNNALKRFYYENIDSLCSICRERLDKNPLRILDCKEIKCSDLNKKAPVVSDYLCADCISHKQNLYNGLEACNIDYIDDEKIVRGLDYYTGTVFEFISPSLGAQSTVCGGGRYNNLVSEIGGPYTPCVGFGLGIERLIMVMEELSLFIGEKENPQVFFINVSEKEIIPSYLLANKLRKHGIKADVNFLTRSVKAQMKYANKHDFNYVIVVGEEEVKNDIYTLKSMKNNIDFTGSIDNIIKFINKDN
ncbi:MAG: histidine--tRNA ligase [Christensenellales bacterium]|jgi:histidyl-tRNA synthetase|nr:histidine--tRNA ligase [Clostridiales bacterium]